jgi:acetyl esterase
VLDPQFAEVLNKLAAAGGPPLHALGAPEIRHALAELSAFGDSAHLIREQVRTTDMQMMTATGKRRARLFDARRAVAGPAPVIVYFHGGGFVACDVDTHDPLCRRLAAASECLVLLAEYRRPPEHRFPAAFEDACAAVRWAAANAHEWGGDANRLAVAGDSAGGNLSAAVAIAARRRIVPTIARQLLIYPMLDAELTRPSCEARDRGGLLDREAARTCLRFYVPEGASLRDWRLSPMHAEDLGGLAPAQIVVAEYDPLRDDGLDYARRLIAAEVPVDLTYLPTAMHGFCSLAGIVRLGAETLHQAGAALGSALLRTP